MRSFPLSSLLTLLAIGCDAGRDDTGDFPFEPGCNTLDGRPQGFLALGDALSQAEDGSVIELCNGQLEESLVISKNVTIQGNGMGRSVWKGSVNEPTIVVTEGVEVTLRDMTIRSTRTGIEATGAKLTLERVFFEGVDNYGVDATDSEIVADEIEITDAGWGGIYVKGGTLLLEDSVLDANTAYGVLAENAAVIELNRNTITGTRFSGDGSSGVEDGWAVSVTEGSTATLVDNVMSGSILGAVEVEASTLSLSGGTLDDNYVGLWIDAALDLDVSSVAITNSYQYGVVLLSSHSASFSEVDILTDPLTSAQEDVVEEIPGSYGIIAIDADFSYADGLISGNNAAGIYLTAQLTTGVSLDLQRTELTDNARFGLAAFLASLTAVDSVISNTRRDLSCEDEFGSFACNFGLTLGDVDGSWTGGGVRDGDGFGVVLFGGALAMEGGDVTNNVEYGVYAATAAFTATGTTFDHPGEIGIGLFEAYGTLIDTTVKNNARSQTWVSSEGTDVYYYSGTDIAAQSGATLTVRGGTFENGDAGIAAFDSVVDVEGATFTGYNARPVDVYLGSASVRDAILTDTGGYVFDCTNAALALEDVVIRDVNEVASWYQSFDITGALLWENKYTYAAPVIDTWGCALELEGVEVEGARAEAIELTDGRIELDGFTARDIGAGLASGDAAVNLTWTTGLAEAALNDLSITSVANADALRIVGRSNAADNIEIERLHVGGGEAGSAVAGAGLYLERLGKVTVDGLSIERTGAAGLWARDVTGVVDGTANGETGRIATTGADAVAVRGGALALSNLAIDAVTGDGLSLTGGNHALTGITAANASGYGMVCEASEPDPAPTFDACVDVVVSGASGEHAGCETCLGE